MRMKEKNNAIISSKKNIYPVDLKYIKDKVEVRSFGNEVNINAQSKLLGEYESIIDIHEKMLKKTFEQGEF